jgi:peptidase E
LPTKTEIDKKFAAADVIWISGGNTQIAKHIFTKTGIDIALKRAALTKVIGGGSAGTLILAKNGMSYSTPKGGPNEYLPVEGLPIVQHTLGVHNDYIEPEDGNTEPRYTYLRQKLSSGALPAPAIGIDDAATLVINGQNFRVLSAAQDSGVTTYQNGDNGLVEARFMPSSSYTPTSQLFE